jgi:polar amino acid transport system substrate-binding protein
VRKIVPVAKGLLSEVTGVGVIGAGSFARGVLLPVLKEISGVELMSICTATGSSAAEAAGKFGFMQATTDVEELLKGPAIGAVLIATRHGSHADLVCRALEAGKHVFVEKPLALTREQLDHVENAFQSGANSGNARVLMVGYNRRFSPHVQAVHEVFAKRKNPMIVNCRVNAGSIPSDHWIRNPEEGGGRIVGEVCHFVDLCSYLTGSEPDKVWASCIGSRDSTTTPDDSLSITLEYGDRSVATIQYVAVGSTELPKERLEVFADGMSAVVDDMKKTTFYGVKAPVPRSRQDKGFRAELETFFRTARQGGPLPISLDSLLRTTRATFAIQESLRTGKPISGF